MPGRTIVIRPTYTIPTATECSGSTPTTDGINMEPTATYVSTGLCCATLVEIDGVRTTFTDKVRDSITDMLSATAGEP
jgi:hypothetical protein